MTDEATGDAGTTDAGTIDAGMTDKGMADAGTTDAGTTDAGTTDAGATGADEALARAETEAAAEAAAVGPEVDQSPGGIDEPVTSTEYSVAFSPRQVAAGFAVVAGLIALVVARRRRRRTPRIGG